MAKIFSFVIHTENCYLSWYWFMDLTLHEHIENWYPTKLDVFSKRVSMTVTWSNFVNNTLIAFGSFSDNFNFSTKKASRTYNFCFKSKRHVVFNWQSVGQIKTRLKAQRYKKDWNKFMFWLFKCLNFLPSRFTVLVTHSIPCIILPLSNIIICFKLSYPWKRTTE